MNTKYEKGIKVMNRTKKHATNRSEIIVGRSNIVNPHTIMVTSNTIGNFVGNRLLRSSPLALIKVLPSRYCTLLKRVIMYGTNVIASRNNKALSVSDDICAAMPTAIYSAQFQKLSWVASFEKIFISIFSFSSSFDCIRFTGKMKAKYVLEVVNYISNYSMQRIYR